MIANQLTSKTEVPLRIGFLSGTIIHFLTESNTYLILVFICWLATSCNSLKKETKKASEFSEVIRVSLVEDKQNLKLSSIVDSVQFINIEQGNSNNFIINKIAFSEENIFILWESSKSISIHERDGKYFDDLISFTRSVNLTDPLSLFYDFQNHHLVVLYEDGVVQEFKIKSKNSIEFVNSKIIPMNSVVDIGRVPNSNSYCFALYNSSADIISTDISSFKLSFSLTEYIVDSHSNRKVALKNSVINDRMKTCFRKYFNDTIYSITEQNLSPYIIFDFSHLSNFGNSKSKLIHEERYIDNIMIFFFNNVSFYSKIIENQKVKYLLRKSNMKLYKFPSDSFINDIFGTTRFSCLGNDLFSNSFVFEVPAKKLDEAINDSVIFEKYISNAKSIQNSQLDNLVLVLLKY